MSAAIRMTCNQCKHWNQKLLEVGHVGGVCMQKKRVTTCATTCELWCNERRSTK